MEVVADAPYYRIMSVEDGANNCEWKETKEKNLTDTGVIYEAGFFDWVASENVNGQKVIKTQEFTEKKLEVNQYLEVFTTFEIDKEGYDAVRALHNTNLTDEDVMALRAGLTAIPEKDNVAEIANYSTFYGEKDVQELNEYYSKYTGYPQGNGYGWISGKVDRDSAPNNIRRDNVKDRSKYEDDTDRSVPVKISILTESIERTITGKVWEDEKDTDPRTTVGTTYGIKTGNGYLDEEETDNGISNVEVSMYEVINLGKLNPDGSYNTEYDNYDYYFKVPNEFYTDSGEIVKTGADGSYTLKGFLPGDYILRFDYGKNLDAEYDFKTRQEIEGGTNYNIYKYNGQDYENTKFMPANAATKFLNTKYLDITGRKDVDLDKNFSVVRDNESRRLVVNSYSRTIENDRAEILRNRNTDEFRDATQMFAETPIMQLEIRDPKKIKEAEEDEDGKFVEKIEEFTEQNLDSSYTVTGINCGLEKRAATDIKLEKFIDTIVIYKEMEPILIAKVNEDGKVDVTNKDSMNLGKVTYLAHSQVPATDGVYNQGFYSLDVESSYLNDLNLDIRYKMRSTNKSEVDFTGKIADYTVASDIVRLASETADNYSNNIIGTVTNTAAAEDELGLASNNTLSDIVSASSTALVGVLTANDKANLQSAQESDVPPSLQSTKISAEDTIRPQVITYGKYVGRFYYENKIDEYRVKGRYKINDYAGSGVDSYLEPITINYEADQVVKTVVDQLVDYIDVDARFAEESQSVNGYWDKVENEKEGGFIKALQGLITQETLYAKNGAEITNQKGAYRTVGVDQDLYDNKNRKYITDTRSNIVISRNEHLQPLERYRNREGNLEKRDNKYITYLDQNIYASQSDYTSTGRVEYQDQDITSIYNSKQTVQLVPEAYYDELYPE